MKPALDICEHWKIWKGMGLHLGFIIFWFLFYKSKSCQLFIANGPQADLKTMNSFS